MNIPRNIGRQITRIQKQMHSRGLLNSSPVVIRWTVTQRSQNYVKDLEGTHGGSVPVEHTESKDAFIHYVNIHQTGYTHNAQVKQGDVILDFPGDVDLEGRESLRFEVGGKIYVQKDGGDELAASWDVRCGGVPITRTLLVTLLS